MVLTRSQATGTTTVPGQRNSSPSTDPEPEDQSECPSSTSAARSRSEARPLCACLDSARSRWRVPRHDSAPVDLHVRGRPEWRHHRILSFTAYDVPADPLRHHRGRPGCDHHHCPGPERLRDIHGHRGPEGQRPRSNVVNVDPAELDLLKPNGSHAIPSRDCDERRRVDADRDPDRPASTMILLDPQLANTGSGRPAFTYRRPEGPDHAWQSADGDDHGSRPNATIPSPARSTRV